MSLSKLAFVMFAVVSTPLTSLLACGYAPLPPNGAEVISLQFDPEEAPADGVTTVTVEAAVRGVREGLTVNFSASAGVFDLAATDPVSARRMTATTDYEGVARVFLRMPASTEIDHHDDVIVEAEVNGYRAQSRVRVIP